MLKTKNKLFQKFGQMTIATKITILYGGLFSFAILVISFIILGNAATINQSLTKQELLRTMDNIEAYMFDGNKTIANKDELAGLLDNKYVEVRIFNLNTREEVKSAVGDIPPFIVGDPSKKNKEFHQNPANGGRNSERVIGARGPEYAVKGDPGNEFMVLERLVNTDHGDYMVQAYKMYGDRRFYVQSFGILLILIDIVGVAGAFWVGKYISRIILRPIETIRQTAERISIEDLSQRMDVSGPNDEMKELSETFNSMIERLERSFKKQNQFVSDASHELRTPISVIQGYANLMNRWGKEDATVLQESIDSIIAETEHMSAMIKKLLLLAKDDQSRAHIQKQQISLNEIAQEVIKELELVAGERQFLLVETEEVILQADPDLLKQLLWIHLENSLKYTTETGVITIHIYTKGEFAYLSIKDDGAGIAEEDIPHIFDRFYRADKSRNQEIPGTGLGLSIADWIVRSHGGKIQVTSTLGEGTEFINSFQIEKEESGENI